MAQTLNGSDEIFDVQENNQGEIFLINQRKLSKHDPEGNLLWEKILDKYPMSYVWGKGVTLSDGGFLFQQQNADNKEILVKIDEAGNIVWEQEYRETGDPDHSISLFVFEVPTGDIIVLSTSGYVTCYKKQ